MSVSLPRQQGVGAEAEFSRRYRVDLYEAYLRVNGPGWAPKTQPRRRPLTWWELLHSAKGS